MTPPRQLFVIILMLCSVVVQASASGLRDYSHPKPSDRFTLYDLKGKNHRIPESRNSAYIISFWATWCAPCIKEMPSLEQAAELLENDGIVVLTINSGENR